jgi:hypothetical protein
MYYYPKIHSGNGRQALTYQFYPGGKLVDIIQHPYQENNDPSQQDAVKDRTIPG